MRITIPLRKILVHLLLFSVTNSSKFTNVRNLSPRKLSGVLRDDNNAAADGLVLFGVVLSRLAIVGYNIFPVVIARFVIGGETEPTLLVGSGKLVVAGVDHGFDVEMAEIYE